MKKTITMKKTIDEWIDEIDELLDKISNDVDNLWKAFGMEGDSNDLRTTTEGK